MAERKKKPSHLKDLTIVDHEGDELTVKRMYDTEPSEDPTIMIVARGISGDVVALRADPTMAGLLRDYLNKFLGDTP